MPFVAFKNPADMDRKSVMKELRCRKQDVVCGYEECDLPFRAAEFLDHPKWKNDDEVLDAIIAKICWSLQNMSLPQRCRFDSVDAEEIFTSDRHQLADNERIIELLSRAMYLHRDDFQKRLYTGLDVDEELVFTNYHVLRFASPRLQEDCSFVYSLMTQWDASQGSLIYAHPNVRNDKAMILRLLDYYHVKGPKLFENPLEFLNHVSRNVWSDPSFCKQAVEIDGGSLKFVTREYREDDQVVLAAVKSNGMALQYVPKAKTEDMQVVLTAVRGNGMALAFASQSLRDNLEVVIAAVKSSGPALQYASERLRDTEEVVAAAITNLGLSFECASDRLKANTDFVVKASKVKKWVLLCASHDVRNQKDAMIEVVGSNPLALSEVGEQLRDDPDVVVTAVALDARAFEYASSRLHDDKTTVMKAMRVNGEALCYSSERSRRDKDIVLTAVKAYPMALEVDVGHLQVDPEVVLCALNHVPKDDLTMYWNQKICDPIKEKLRDLADRLQNDHGDDYLKKKLAYTVQVDAATADSQTHIDKKRKVSSDSFEVREWNRRQWERILGQLGSVRFNFDICRTIIEYADLNSVFAHEKDLIKFEGLINKILQHGLTCYANPSFTLFPEKDIHEVNM